MVFITLEGLFKVTVTFVGLTNLSAIFQAIMNELLKDLINMEKVESFIDNMMVGTENKKGHNELVKEILRRIKENNLYIKLKESK